MRTSQSHHSTVRFPRIKRRNHSFLADNPSGLRAYPSGYPVTCQRVRELSEQGSNLPPWHRRAQ
jgi:hypothetical protein